MKIIKKIQMAFTVLLLLSITACGKTPSARFYTLTSMAEVAESSKSRITGKHIIGIGPVKVAAYLDRAEIVTRSSPTHIELANFDRWAEPFDDIVANSLADNIASLLPSVYAITNIWPEAKIEYQLLVNIKKFESDTAGNVYLDASWGIIHHSDRKMKVVYESKLELPGSSSSFDEITKNMSLALVKLSEEIAVELKKLGVK